MMALMSKWLQTHPGLALLEPHYHRHVAGFVQGFFLLAATTLTAAAIPYVMKLATDALSSRNGETAFYALILMGLALLNALLRIRSRTHVYRIGREVEYGLRQDYHHHLLWMDAPFFDRSRTGDLVSRGTNDILAIRMFIGPGFLQVSNTAMAYAITLPVMIGLDPWLTLVALSPYPVVLVVARLLTRRLYQLSRQVADRFGELTGAIQESLSGLAVIRNHGQEARWQGRFDEQLGILYNAHANHTNMQSVFSPLMLFSGAVSGLFILGYGGRQVAEGTLTVGDFVAFTGYLALLIWPTIGLGWILTVMQRGLAALDRLHMVLSLPVVHRQEEGVEETERWRGEIQVKDLTFAYAGSEQPVLKNLSLSVAPGAFVGLVGRVGCGKSALLNCLANLYPVPAGTVFLDGREINTIPEAVLRHNLTMAPQESFLFSIPVVENLLYGREESTEEEGWRLAEQVSLAEEIKIFPKGMQTLVGERGITLSGGQRQRVALARALAMHTPIVLLDDIFSSVDARTEAAILQHLFHGQSYRPTVVMVCHRVAALHQAEVIHVMEEGRIVASGTHQQLLTQSPLYGELHQRMARAEALESLQ